MSAGQRAARRAIGVLAVALFAWWAMEDGGYAPGAWYPGALLLLTALVGCVRPRMLAELPPATRVALAALAAFTAWSFCSIAWADARGEAWDGANRTLLYLTVFTLFAAVPWTVEEAVAGLGAFAVATAGVGASEIARAVAGAAPDVFLEGRLAGPVGYENASAALFLVAFWAALLVAAHRPTPPWVRGIMLATAGLLLQLTILAQSRGALVAGIVTLVLAVAFVPEKVPLLTSLLAVAAVTAVSLPTLLDVFEAAPGEPDLGAVALALGLSATLLFGAGLALERGELWAARRARGSPVRALATAAALITAAGAALAVGTPADSRFAAGLGSGRYDLWRVATLEFARHPIGGVGADNFTHDYVRERRRREEPRYPHSLVLRAVAQLGAVGGALLALFLAAVVVAVRGIPLSDLGRRTVAVAALVAGAAWLVHGSIDWLWEMPAVAAPAMACLGLAAGLGPRAAGVRLGSPFAAGAGIVAVAAALSLALPALAARDVEGAAREWGADPGSALRRLERARRLNPLSDRPDLVRGALARQVGDRDTARRAFLAALARDERNWHAHVELGLLDQRGGRHAAALERLRRARELNPGERLIAVALQAAGGGEPPSRALQDRLSELAIPGPIGRRPVDCRPVLGLGSACARETVP